jgi:hypothetical protein
MEKAELRIRILYLEGQIIKNENRTCTFAEHFGVPEAGIPGALATSLR